MTQPAAAAAQAEGVKERIEAAFGRSRIALRLAGTSRAEQQALLAHYTRQTAEAHEEQQQAERAVAAACGQAWQTLRVSPYAEALRAHGALGDAPGDPAAMRQRFAAMQAALPLLATQIDTARAEAAQQARLEAVELHTKARNLRAVAEQLRAEQPVRRLLDAQDPQRHASGEPARAALQQERRHGALHAQQAREQILHQRPSDGLRTGM